MRLQVHTTQTINQLAVILQNCCYKLFFMVTYDINDKYCPCGNCWIRVPSSTLFGDCYYCEKCDKIYQPTVKEVTKEWFKENYVSDRFSQIKNLAKIIEAKSKITKDDLIKLGYLK